MHQWPYLRRRATVRRLVRLTCAAKAARFLRAALVRCLLCFFSGSFHRPRALYVAAYSYIRCIRWDGNILNTALVVNPDLLDVWVTGSAAMNQAFG
jgi:hypothetical protein